MQQLDNLTSDHIGDNGCAELVIETVLLGGRTIRNEIRRHRPSDLSVPQFRVLAFLNRHDGASLSDLAGHLGLTLPSMSNAIDVLVKRGLVTRGIVPNNRRRVHLSLTIEGSDIFNTAAKAARTHITERMKDLPPKDKETITKAMLMLRDLFAAKQLSETSKCD